VASNRDLEEEVREGVFRADLFYRINAMTIKLPPLRERREDIPELCNYFIRLFNSANNKNIAGLTPEALKKLHQYEWPGNVRQLRNVIERAVIFSSSEYLIPGDLTLPFEEQSEEGADTREQERNQVIRVIKKYNGRVSKVIRELGVSRGSFYYYLKKNNIDINKYRKRMITLQ
jgi:DNA-binding NtrC family response regulator